MQAKRNVMAMAATMLFTGAVSAQELIVKIGHVAPTSGWMAPVGRDHERSARMAIDELNARGTTIGGKMVRFELLAEDDAADPKKGIAVAQKLVDAKVNGVIGHLTSGTSIPASKVYSDAGIPQISPSSTNPQFTRNGYKTTFRVLADDTQLGGALGRYAVNELKATEIAVIDDRSAYGQGIAEEFSKAVRAAGGSIVLARNTDPTATDFTEVLTTVKSKSAKAVFFGGMNIQAGKMIAQMKQLGINAKFMGGDGICGDSLPTDAAGNMDDGQVVCAVAGGVEGTQKAGMDNYRERFKAKYYTDSQGNAPYAYDAVNVMVAAMVKAGSAEPAKYLPVLAETEGFKGVTGTISFDSKGDVKNGALTLLTYNGGKREMISVMR